MGTEEYFNKLNVKEYSDDKYDEDGQLIYGTDERKDFTNGNVQLYNKSNHCKYYRWGIKKSDLPANTSVSFYVIVQYPEYTTDIINNKAFLNENRKYTSSIYRNEDYDYVMMNRHKVSLEKFVSEVTDKNEQNVVNYDRDGYRYNSSLKDGNTNKKTYKPNNPVELEAGDKVTYTIRLKNTGDLPVKVNQIYDTFTNIENGIKLVYDSNYGIKLKSDNGLIDNFGTMEQYIPGVGDEDIPNGFNRYKIDFDSNKNILLNNKGDYIDVLIRFIVSVPSNLTTESQKLINQAEISRISNENGEIVTDSDGRDNNADEDHVITKTYAVSLEKYVSKVIRPDTSITEYAREGKAQYKNNNQNREKYDEVVTLSKGDIVIYNIKVNNDGDTPVSITNIADYLPNGVKYLDTSYIGDTYCTGFEHKPSSYDETGKLNPVFDNGQTSNKQEFTESIYLEPKTSNSFEVKVEVIEPNGSNNILKNVAEIISMKNKNEIEVIDTTPNNNKDADYIQLDKIPDEPDPEVIDYIVEKKWVDNDNEFKTRPNSIKVQLYKNNNKQGSEITLNAENNWTYTWEKLPKEDNNGDDYVYSVVETGVPSNYTVNYETGDSKTTIINSYNKPDEFISKTVSKEWLDNDNKEGKRPTSITVQLYENHKAYGTPIKLNEGNSWTYTWERLKESNVYTIQEVKVPGYNVTYGSNENEFVIYNQIEDVPPPEDPSSPDVIIGGYVWNDKALNKKQDNYNGILDSEEEHILEGIKVYLYREGITKAISVKHTDKNGYYSFANTDIDKSVVTEAYKQYIKGPKVEGTNRWDGPYYSYYVVFEYDGVKYTSTPNGQSCEDIINSPKDYHTDSNAKEDNGKVVKDREDFNKEFNPINNASGIDYTTKNEEGYIPQSNYVYNSSMAMQSSTNLINLESLLGGKDYSKEEDLRVINDIEDKIKYVGLGLRGRDIFDLELTSDVDNIKVTVNGQQGVYEYSNKVKLRQADLTPNSTTDEDMANKVSESNHTYVDSQEQKIRETDFDVTKTKTNKTHYNSTQGVQNIEVTYKITVQNTSRTAGTATKIINYYDSKYSINMNQTVKGSYYYYDNEGKRQSKAITGIELSNDEQNGQNYKSVLIEIPETMLEQSETMEIYLVYTLNTPITETLKGLAENNPIPTYNMTEITEYKTGLADGQTEYTRGLLDKDSAPSSANTEKARLHPDLIGQTSTVEYYFGGNDLSVLKYEDDTYATPTLYFVSDSSQRTMTGKVFRDETTVDSETKIKTGNGKIDSGEVGVYGATVELIEQVDSGKVRYTTFTNENGEYKFEGFLPGNYIIKYHYGDTEKTVLLNKFAQDINKDSFNGEDYQATNNTGTHGAARLNSETNYWYVYNETEGISTATDNKARRSEVSKNVVAFTEEQMTELNKIREGNNSTMLNSLMEATKMNASTPNMLFGVEEKVLDDRNLKDQTTFGEYIVSNMNFGLAEVPVTRINLQKEVAGFIITDSTGQNVIAKAGISKDDGTWKVETGIVEPTTEGYATQIEDAKLQGARLQITYNIKSNIVVERNFDGKGENPASTINGLIDIVDNNLSYNPNLNDNSNNWEVLDNSTDILSSLENISDYSTIVEATPSAIKNINSGNEITITLEKVLSSTDSTIEEIITSSVSPYEYNNIIEITELDYRNTTSGEITSGSNPDDNLNKDRIRTPDNYTILAGKQYDTAISGTISIIPPTGALNYLPYYIMAIISLGVLVAGVFGVRKVVLSNKK